MAETKYCKHCGQIIDADCVVCPKCGKQVEDLKTDQQSVIINNNTVAAHPLLLLHQQLRRRVQAKEYTSQENQKINGLLSSCVFLLYADTNFTKENSEWVSCTSVLWGFSE